MPPLLHCVRHAQGWHNLSLENHNIPDPTLTPYGEQQCHDLQAKFPHHSTVKLLVASPLRRTLQTTILSFGPEIKAGMHVIALPEAQEVGAVPCDTGSEREVLEKEFGVVDGRPGVIEFELVVPGWNSKQGKWDAHSKAIKERAKYVRQWLKARPEAEVVLITHGAFLHYLTEDWSDCDRFAGTGWANAEFRSYEFVQERPTEIDSDDRASMVETTASKTLRHKIEKPAANTEEAEAHRPAGHPSDSKYVAQSTA